MAQPSLDDIAAASADNGVQPTLDEIATNSVSPAATQSSQSAQNASYWAQAQQKIAQNNNQGIMPYEQAMEQTVNRLPGLLTSVPASIATNLSAGTPQNIISDLGKTVTGQTSPDYTTLLKTAGIPSPVANIGGTAMDVALFPGGAKAVSQIPSLLAAGSKNVLGAGSTLLQHLLGQDIQTKFVPEMEGIYQNRVQQFTPQIQELATKTLGVPQEIVDHIAQKTPQVVTAAAQGLGNDPAAIQQTLETGLAQKDAVVTAAYKNSIGQAPANAVIQIPKTVSAASDYLEGKGIIQNGELTPAGEIRINTTPSPQDNSPLIDRAIYGKYLQLKQLNGQVTPAQWVDMRNGLSGIRNSANYEAPATNLLDALHSDIGDAGFDVQSARQLAAQQFAAEKLAKPFISMSGENKFANVFGLSTKQLNNMQAVGDYIGQPLVEQAKNVQSAGALQDKIIPYGQSYIGSPSKINIAVENVGGVSPFPSAFAKRAQAEFKLHEILGKGTDVTSLLSNLNNRKLIIGAGGSLGGYGTYTLIKRLGIGEK